MFYFINFLVILNYSIFLALILKRNISKMFPLSMIFMSLIIYISGLFSNFIIGMYILLILNILFLLYSCYSIFFIKKNIKEYFDTASIVFIIVYFLSIFIFKNRLLSIWDEFSHWGLLVKNMYFINDFADIHNSTIRFITYPPIVGIWEYIYSSSFKTFDESNLLIAYFILLFSFCTATVDFSKPTKKWKKIGLIFLFFLVPTIFNKEVYISLYVDFLLGIIGAYIIVIYNNYEEKNWKFYIELFLLSSFIVLVKATGLAIILFCIIFFILDGIRTKKIKESFKISLFSILTAVMFNFSWSYILKLSGYSKSVREISVINRIITMVSEKENNVDYQIFQAFIKGVFKLKINIEGLPVTAFLFFLFFIILFIIGIIKKKNLLKFISGYIILVLFLYTVSLYITYLTNFAPEESLRLASYERYFSTIAIFVTWISLYYFFCYQTEKSSRLFNYLVVITILTIINYQTLGHLTFSSYKRTKKINLMRSQYKFSNIHIKLDKNKKIFFISQNEDLHDGYDYWVALYSFTPAHIQDIYTTSLGLPYSELDSFSQNISSHEWEEMLKTYDYVYLHKINDRFIRDYSALFNSEIKPDSLYKIEKSDNVKLIIIK